MVIPDGVYRGRIIIRQGPVRRKSAGRRKPPPPAPEYLAEAAHVVEGVEDDALREALIRLGARALANKPTEK